MGLRWLLLQTCALLALAFIPAECITNIALLYSIVGATCGSLVCFVLPGVVFLCTDAPRRDKVPAALVAFFGVVSCIASIVALVLGTTLQPSGAPQGAGAGAGAGATTGLVPG